MLSNSEIVELLELTTKLMELHGVDQFKTRAYSTAAFHLDKYNERNLGEMSATELSGLQGIGKSLASKLIVLFETGKLADLEELLAQTPPGVLEMFRIKGIGPKKIAAIWKDLGIESVYDLEIACQNGRVAKLKGFGEGTQQKILDSITFLKNQSGKLRMDEAASVSDRILKALRSIGVTVEPAGAVVRNLEIADKLHFVVGAESPVSVQVRINQLDTLEQNVKNSSPFVWRGSEKVSGVAVEILIVNPERLPGEVLIGSSGELHLAHRTGSGKTIYQLAKSGPVTDAESFYSGAGLPYIVPAMREGLTEWEWAEKHTVDELVTWDSLKGILHNHSTYSDGRHTLEQMAVFCRELGFEYLGIADHSQSATYARGLRDEDILRQHAEITVLNNRFASENPAKPFRIFKGIESDILGDGSLDYPDGILGSFDYVVASVHSNLSMTREKATARLIKAVENPYTTILGHPTGRLLLSRAGYPIDYEKVIDACAANGVIMEINASPWRLDLDWRWIAYCMDKGVMLSINPDAHEMDGYYDMRYGVAVAQKGGLTKEMTFNALPVERMDEFLQKKKS